MFSFAALFLSLNLLVPGGFLDLSFLTDSEVVFHEIYDA